MERVTVVVAARDAARTLPQTLSSLAAQTYPDWAAIVVDDGSTDDTAELAAVLGERVRVLRNTTPLGPAGARNRGVASARTELIATLDADDLWRPRYLEQQIARYDRARADGRRVAAVCCDAELIDVHGAARGRWSERVPLPDTVTLDALLRENVVYNSVLISREVFEAMGGSRADMIWGEDYDLWLRLAEQGWEIAVNRESLAVYRLRPDALSADSAGLSSATRAVYEGALGRGRLTARQRKLARRQRRLHALLERRALLAVGAPRRPSLAGVRLAPAATRVALEHPGRWAGWLRRGPRRAGSGRHVHG
jgi:glycosyltransferase involved in cell wall biosynthesis